MEKRLDAIRKNINRIKRIQCKLDNIQKDMQEMDLQGLFLWRIIQKINI